ncbi:MAG: bifunctional UDP-N-acetylmuramoyl-tripeptide:D-alanyl-D-alanine ligase/alanine racemase [Bacteroides sp.]|nr:bifunctional UDP-N-acetylmuramoyl-tripeptide:D-alanyl-D-alanine ligase/alanine racemase [Bacteroides sp.]
MHLHLDEIAERLGVAAPAGNPLISTLLTDSRSLIDPEGTLFFAIPTSGNDGHKYIPELYRQGVRNFVVNKVPEALKNATDINWLVTDNTVLALQKTAARNRDFKGELIGITGSRGKTTLKEWIFQLMEPLSDISRSPRSYNSQIGVPLSMWEISPDASLAIIEAGISRAGEMKSLADCIMPDTVIITNVGDAHSEGFDSYTSKVNEKLILAAAPSVGKIIYCADYPEIAKGVDAHRTGKELIGWSRKNRDADLYITPIPEAQGEMRIEYKFKGETHSLIAPLSTDTDIENAANALAYMLSKGIDPDIIVRRFANLHRIGTRLNVTDGVGGCSVILDSYTSDFSSLLPALDFMRRRKIPSQTTTLILSDLHHESASQPELYADVAALVKRADIERFIGVGKVLTSYSDLFPAGSLFFESTAELLLKLSPSDFNDEIILLKGSPEYNFSDIAEMLECRKHETVLEVNLDSIVSNYNYFRSHLPASTGVICMVKASGYGAGSYEIAKTLQDCGAAYLAVAVIDEGIELRNKGITMSVMVMNPKIVNYKSMFAYRLEPEIYSFDMLRDVIAEAEKNNITDYPIHIKIDTGMHRMGFIEEELPAVMDILAATNAVRAKSTFSHLATADCPDMDDYTELQLERFARYTDYMLSRSSYPILRHILNSPGILRYPQYHYDMARLGIGLYGANTLPPEMEKPLAVVSTLRTVIIAIREYQPGETIGYGRWGKIERPSKIATIPIGYADGMNRHFGRGNISVMVNGKEAPTIGNICMDMCMIDVTGIECAVGDSVEIFGQKMPLQRLADTLDTIPYEILTSVSPRVKRVYYRE